jgi:hypothetical protein
MLKNVSFKGIALYDMPTYRITPNDVQSVQPRNVVYPSWRRGRVPSRDEGLHGSSGPSDDSEDDPPDLQLLR